MRVLLIGPLPKLDPPTGDITFVRTLLDNPPPGVIFEDYHSAMLNGRLKEHYTRASLRDAWQSKGNWLGEAGCTVLHKSVNQLRRLGILFADRYRFFSVEPGYYDLIHMHVFQGSFLNQTCPVVVSAFGPLPCYYVAARQWPKSKVELVGKIEKFLGSVLNVNLSSFVLPQTARLLTHSQFAKEWFVRANVLPEDKIDVIGPFQDPPLKVKEKRLPRKIVFVAKDFPTKGGPVLLEAFEQVRKVCDWAELHIIGSDPLISKEEAAARKITWTAFIPREQLLAQLPECDIFAYPTSFDLTPYVLLEAMSFGLPIATSDFSSISEMVDFGRAGKISPVGDAAALAKNLIELMDPECNATFARAAYEHYSRTFSTAVVHKRLISSYEAALAAQKVENHNSLVH
jgi:glycosyltransferase involved in cell wall biosynthesis